MCWQRHCDTREEPADFCSNHEFVSRDSQGNEIYECKGHDYWAAWEAKFTPELFAELGGVKGITWMTSEQALPPEAEMNDAKLADWWDFIPAESKFIRMHEVPREKFCC